MRLIETAADLEEGIAVLSAREPRFAGVAARGLPSLRRRGEGFATLVEIITEQMISLKAAGAILQRLRRAFDPLEPERLLEAHIEDLMVLGLSGAKASSVFAVATAASEGRLDFRKLASLSDDEVRRCLTCLPGIGAWTAEIYLLTALGRSDAWPGGDVALRGAAESLFGLKEKPKDRVMQGLAEPWRPWRSVAARLLWSHYRHIRGISADAARGPLHRVVAQDIVGSAGT
jgi:DNA-3-methyladenine glycosylase II